MWIKNNFYFHLNELAGSTIKFMYDKEKFTDMLYKKEILRTYIKLITSNILYIPPLTWIADIKQILPT